MSDRTTIIKPQQTLYIIVDADLGTHHGTFDSYKIAMIEASEYAKEHEVRVAIFSYKLGSLRSVAP